MSYHYLIYIKCKVHDMNVKYLFFIYYSYEGLSLMLNSMSNIYLHKFILNLKFLRELWEVFNINVNL